MINDFFGIGNCGNEPVEKVSTNGVKWVEFSICINDVGKDKKPKSNWIKCKAFNNNADYISKYLHKGDKAMIHAKISTWTIPDNNGQITKSGLDFIILNIEILSRHQTQVNNAIESVSTTVESAPTIEITSDDLPF